jgi:hypothetical protein
LAQKKFESKRSKDKTKDVCNYCKKLGHCAREWKKKKVDWKNKNEQNNSVLEANDEANNGKTFMYALFVSFGFTTWYIDYGASTHLSHEHSWLTNYEKNSPIKIYMGDNSVQEVIGKGNIQVSMSVGGNERVKAILTNVLS